MEQTMAILQITWKDVDDILVRPTIYMLMHYITLILYCIRKSAWKSQTHKRCYILYDTEDDILLSSEHREAMPQYEDEVKSKRFKKLDHFVKSADTVKEMFYRFFKPTRITRTENGRDVTYIYLPKVHASVYQMGTPKVNSLVNVSIIWNTILETYRPKAKRNI